MDLSSTRQEFKSLYGCFPDAIYFAPGRVNLIGEHIDYNGGRVMPVAIDRGTCFAVRTNDSSRLRIHSELYGETTTIQYSDLSGAYASGSWRDYAVGMTRWLLESSRLTGGADVYVSSDLPQKSGLSSSASFCVGLGYALADQSSPACKLIELALAAKTVENEFVGVNCGIMDQIAVAVPRAGHCIVLDCDSLQYEFVPMDLEGCEIVITNSMVSRKLSESRYNLRYSECRQALEVLRRETAVEHLCELSVEQVDSSIELQKHPVLKKRARHVCSENARVGAADFALKEGQLAKFGALMNASHDSLRDDFEVSCPELDFLVETALSIPGVLGSRMTGAGFGGCTVSLVESGRVHEFSRSLSRAYTEQMAHEAEIYPVRPGKGVGRVA